MEPNRRIEPLPDRVPHHGRRRVPVQTIPGRQWPLHDLARTVRQRGHQPSHTRVRRVVQPVRTLQLLGTHHGRVIGLRDRRNHQAGTGGTPREPRESFSIKRNRRSRQLIT